MFVTDSAIDQRWVSKEAIAQYTLRKLFKQVLRYISSDRITWNYHIRFLAGVLSYDTIDTTQL
jgi:hypothetical protein